MARQRPDGRWEERARIDGRRISFYGATEREAIAARNAYLRKHDPDRSPGRAPTLSTWLDRWLDETRPPFYAWNTWRKHESASRVHLVPHLGGKRLPAIARPDVVKLVHALVAGGMKPRSADKVRESLATALTAAVEAGWVKANVALKSVPVSSATDTSEELEPLDAGEARRVIEAARGDRLEALFLLNLTTGMRQGEILGLAWEDIDMAGGYLVARHQLQREPGSFVRTPLKGRRSRRIYLPPIAIEALERRRARQGEEGSHHPWGLVFTTPDGRPLGGSTVRLLHRAVLERAGVRAQKFHDLRHAAATMLLDQGVPMHLVSAMLGHAQISTTDRVYRHLSDRARRRTADAMETLLRGPESG